MTLEGRQSLGVLCAQLVPRPDWLSTRIPELYLELSTCHGQIEPDTLPLYSMEMMTPGEVDEQTVRVELGVSAHDAVALQAEPGLGHLLFMDAPRGAVLGYEVLGFDWAGSGWHTQHCHNAADSAEGQTVTFNELGLIKEWVDAAQIAKWYGQEESGAEPVFWLPVSVHRVAHR